MRAMHMIRCGRCVRFSHRFAAFFDGLVGVSSAFFLTFRHLSVPGSNRQMCTFSYRTYCSYCDVTQ